MTEKILIVGGAGYIGSHVVLSFLDAGFDVSVLDNLSTGRQENLFPDATFFHGDLHDRTGLQEVFREGFDTVVHLAAAKAAGESMLLPDKYSRANLIGTLNLLEAVGRSSTRRFIFSSTAAVYGDPQYLPIDEKHPLNPRNYYGFTKLEIERFLKWQEQLKGIRFVCLRYFNAAGYDPQGRVVGLEQNPANLIPIVMEVAAGIREKLEIFGGDYPTPDGTCLRDYVHVSDLAKAHVDAQAFLKQKDESLTVNLGSGKGYSVMDIVRKAEQICGRPIPHQIVGRREGDPAELYASSQQAELSLGWKESCSNLETLIESTWMCYQRAFNLQ
ncbi:MAG: UDP-glucose 4-epimerase GalE [SAR324 cluster bacterium]|uniref:UDP-glucose 4-epimerase n=1 Tax=SAR324 cluster bacterium TaxID=2024889 RepID=A0A2A4T4P1_9DELT|nr:MAG: UDP-glucose 4-epimerase GalE [SAR324 cluster bacterium]